MGCQVAPQPGALHHVDDLLLPAAAGQAAPAVGRDHPRLKVLLLSCAGINDIDASGIDTLRRIHRQLADSGRCLACCGLKKQVIDVMERTGLWNDLAPQAAYRTEDHALQHLLPTLSNPPAPAAPRQGFAW